MPDAGALRRFYDHAYGSSPEEAERYGRWRALGAVGKADHVVALCGQAGLRPTRVADIGCGDGALLSELHRRGFATRLEGFEITEAAVALARQRPEIAAVTIFDGDSLPVADRSYDLAVLSHVLEHVPDPPALLAETARVSRAVVVEVPLEDNLSARRGSRRRTAAEVGHLHRFNRRAIAGLVDWTGLQVAAELQDALPLAVHTFFARSRGQRARGALKWAVRQSLVKALPAQGPRLITVHYACLCLPGDG